MPALAFFASRMGTVRRTEAFQQSNSRATMNPLCPSCSKEMSKTSSSRNMFRCEPCREIIQFFDLWQDRDTEPPRDVKRPVERAA
jgi:tRNA(Ile2) C34 agmatinyltransferase TiaS